MRIEFTIPGIPVPQPRVKFSSGGGFTKAYTPTSVKQKDGTRKSNGVAEFKSLVKMCAREAYQGAPLNEPVRIDCCWVFPRGSTKFWKTKPTPRYPHVVKPDRDNLDKMVLDSLVGIMLADDNCVCAGYLEKWCAAGDEQPHVRIVISTLNEHVEP